MRAHIRYRAAQHGEDNGHPLFDSDPKPALGAIITFLEMVS